MRPIYFLIFIAAITIFFMVELFNPFLKAMFVALLLAVATNSLTSFIELRLKSRAISTSIMTFTLGAIFFIPVMYCIFSFANFFNHIDQQILVKSFQNVKLWVENISDDFLFLKQQLNQILEKIDFAQVAKNILSIGAYLGKNSASFMIDMVMILIFFFFFTLYAKGLSTYIKDLLPIKKDDSITLFYESSNVMTVVLYSILVTAIFEGFLFGFFLTFFRYDGLLLGVLYGFASLIPVVGGIIMWLPIVIYEVVTGSISNAIVIAVYSILMISIFADTFAKPIIIKYINQKIVKTPTNVNEVFIFFSIVAGLSTFGFWGMIIGPAMVTFFISIMHLIKKYSDEIKDDIF
ncbi:AI-2E family transporter [Poseidonibacter sp.]|uniref:AI-2E family transporter n=1 Tax=Poseidonibacter sp. TaxID=2321188 RepID=UPI00359D0EEF